MFEVVQMAECEVPGPDPPASADLPRCLRCCPPTQRPQPFALQYTPMLDATLWVHISENVPMKTSRILGNCDQIRTVLTTFASFKVLHHRWPTWRVTSPCLSREIHFLCMACLKPTSPTGPSSSCHRIPALVFMSISSSHYTQLTATLPGTGALSTIFPLLQSFVYPLFYVFVLLMFRHQP